MNEMRNQLIAALNENEGFCRAFVSAKNAEELKKVLNDSGFDVSTEEIEAMFSDGMNEIVKLKDGEFSEEQLDAVSGGGTGRYIARAVVSCGAAFGYGCVCGLCPAASAAAPYVVTGLTAWTAAGYFK